jgi:eukaryotic-like serine/threonine-protein kinase
VIGESIGNFRITTRLGRGGMGEVYAGEHDGIQTRVAIKMLLPEVSRSQEYVQRFFNEAKIVGRIKHAGIVKIFDVGFHNEHAYLIMELLEGETLAARIDRDRALPPAQIVEIARQIASVLDATHHAGVIHRDLKPDNVFLVADRELPLGERVKILDFGISKPSGTLAGHSPRTQGTMGTPQYMAPEQWGDSATVDWRADAYSLGCVCYEMASGRPPFDANNIAEAYAKHLNATPPPLAKLGVHIPAALESLIMRLLAKRPADRAPSMAMVVGELDDLSRAIDPDAKSTVPRHARPATAPSQPGTGPTLPMRTGPATPIQTDATVRLAAVAKTTTLGSAASQLDLDPTPPRRRGMVAMIAAGAAVVVALVVFAMTRTTGSTTPAPIAPAAAPIPTPPAPAPAPAPTPPIPAPPPTPTPTPTPSTVPSPPATTTTTKPKHPKAPPVVVAPAPTPTPTPPPPAGSADVGDPWGGRR